jgi:hypothetical protein
MSPSKRLQGTSGVGERHFGVSPAKFLTMLPSDECFLWSKIYSLRLGLPRHAPLHGGHRPLPVLQPPASAMSHVPSQRIANTCQGGQSLDRQVRTTACLPGRGWWCFGVSNVSSDRLQKREIPGSGACSTRAVSSDCVSRR